MLERWETTKKMDDWPVAVTSVVRQVEVLQEVVMDKAFQAISIPRNWFCQHWPCGVGTIRAPGDTIWNGSGSVKTSGALLVGAISHWLQDLIAGFSKKHCHQFEEPFDSEQGLSAGLFP